MTNNEKLTPHLIMVQCALYLAAAALALAANANANAVDAGPPPAPAFAFDVLAFDGSLGALPFRFSPAVPLLVAPPPRTDAPPPRTDSGTYMLVLSSAFCQSVSICLYLSLSVAPTLSLRVALSLAHPHPFFARLRCPAAVQRGGRLRLRHVWQRRARYRQGLRCRLRCHHR